MQTPVLLLFFNRPKHAESVLARLRAVQPARVYAHVDGPRAGRPEEEKQVLECRRLIHSIDWPCEVKTLFREQNMGLRNGVFDAINWFFREESCGIVLEDDCLPDPTFFPYCEELLKQYADDERIMHIAGSNMAAPAMTSLECSYFASKFSLVWGWASWRRAWKKMSMQLDGLGPFTQNENWQHFLVSKPAKAYMRDKFQATAEGKNNSWAYAWFYSILKNDGICLVPAKNLIENVGVGDAGATHTKNRQAHLQIRAESLDFPLKHPNNLTPDPELEQFIFNYTQKTPFRLRIWYLLHQLGLR